LTAVLVGGGRFFVIKDSPSPAFLFRGGVLLSLPGREPGGPSYAMTPPNGGDPVPVTPVLSDLATWTAGDLEDGDALVVCSQALMDCREEADISRALQQSSSPRMAAGRLAEEAHQRGVDGVVVTALFAGMNPASVPPRADAAPQATPLASYQAPPPPTPVAATPTAAAPINEVVKTPWIAALAGLAGASIGVAIGVVLAVSLLRPEPAAPIGSSRDRLVLPGPESGDSTNSASYPTQPTVNSNPSPVYTGYQPNTSGPSSPVVRPQTNPIRPGPVNVSGLPPVTQSSTPPRHAIASGMTTKVQVTLYYDQRSGLMIMTSNQGVLYTQDAPLGVPAGEFVAADPGAALRRKADDPQAELHFVADENVVARIQGEDFRKLVSGIPIAVPDLAPMDYKLVWFSPNDANAVPPFTNLRIGGI
jgi:hypothetical protein